MLPDDFQSVQTMKIGRGTGSCIDIDPQAIEASRDNAQRNGVSDQLELYLPEDQPAGLQADIVVANILAGPLRELSGLISGLVKAQGRMAISGILESQAPELLEVYSQWFAMNPATTREEWCRLDGIKKA